MKIASLVVSMLIALTLIPRGASAIDLGPPGERGSTGNTEVLGRTSFSTEDVAEGSVNEGCVEYCPYTGVCIWIVCTFFSCSVETSEKVGHTSPDFVVTSYMRSGESPWEEAKSAYGSASKEAVSTLTGLFTGIAPMVDGGMNWKDHQVNEQDDDGLDTRERQRQLWFKETAVIGNPAIDVHREVIQSAGLHACPVDIDEFEPYFQSEFDAIAWRGLSPQTMLKWESWTPGAREIGQNWVVTWGSVHPRIGYLTGTEGPKVAAVTAQRAIDITTREDQMRVYRYPYDEVYPPNYRDPSDEKTDRWLMIHPAKEHKCYTFGQDQDYAVIDDGARNAEEEGYGYLYWSLVQCCEPLPGLLIATIDVPPVCVGL